MKLPIAPESILVRQTPGRTHCESEGVGAPALGAAGLGAESSMR